MGIHVSPQNVKIGDISFSTLDLVLLLVFGALAVWFAVHVVSTADDKTWQRLYAIFTGLAGFLAGWFGKKLTTNESPTTN